jgi:hypothetical protein
MHICFRTSQAMQQFEYEELRHMGIPNITMHMPQSLQGKMQIFKMHLLARRIALDNDNALLRLS